MGEPVVITGIPSPGAFQLRVLTAQVVENALLFAAHLIFGAVRIAVNLRQLLARRQDKVYELLFAHDCHFILPGQTRLAFGA